jgi:hypothetical protein
MKALAGLLCLLLAGCSTQQPSSPSPSPSANVVFVCSPTDFHCSDFSEAGILTAVAGLGYPVKTVTIGLTAHSCPVPEAFLPETAPPCLPPYSAYVSFVGTDKIAQVELGDRPDGSGVYVVLGFAPNDSSPAP